MKKHILALVAILFCVSATAQDKINISGSIFDQVTEEPIEYASIRVLSAKDSTYVTGTATNTKGTFNLGLSPNKYILQVSYMGYNNHYEDVSAYKSRKLKEIYMVENSILLNEAVVEAKAVEIQVKGDTVEYNADSYKVQENAVVEDLLKKMPGVEVDEDGKITVNGKEIKKILIDGKEFFTDDPKVASKNLPAQMVNKLQVVDRKSEMAQLTGFDDDEEETVINLTIKKGMKQGVFGNAFAGAGSKDRYEGNGIVNYMRDNKQMTALGGVNNTNNAGFSDIASGNGAGGPPRGVSFGGRNGVSKSTSGGFNMAMDVSEKFKWNGDVNYGGTDNNVISKRNRLYNDKTNAQSLVTNSFGNNDSRNFKSNFRLEWKPDSATTIIFRPSLTYGRNIRYEKTYDELFNPGDTLINYDSESEATSSGKNLNASGRLFVSRKLSDAGRTISVALSGGIKDGDSHGKDWFERKYYNDPLALDSIKDQLFEQNDKTRNWRANVSYVEPLGRNNFLQLSYTVRQNNSLTDKVANRNVGTHLVPNYSDVDTLYTRNVENDFLNQNVTLSFKSIRQKFNYTIGIGLEPSSSKTTIKQPLKDDLSTPRKNFLSFAPNMIFNYLWDKRHNLRMSYRGETSQPTTLQLFNGITSSNGTTTVYGNPDLRPSFTNSFLLRYQKFNPERASFMMVIARFNQTMNDIVSISNRRNGTERETRYLNMNGNFDGSLRLIMNSPLRNKKFSANSMSFASYSRSNTFINQDKNRANIIRLVESVGLNYRSDQFDFNLRGNIGYTNMDNSTGVNNQNTYTYGGFGSATWYLPFSFVLDSDLNYSANAGYSNGFQKKEWLWNASASKQVFKNKAGTIRFKIYDILKERSNITRNSVVLYVEDVTSNTLNSYFMVHFIYKFQFFKGGAKMGDMSSPSQGGRTRGHGGGGRPH